MPGHRITETFMNCVSFYCYVLSLNLFIAEAKIVSVVIEVCEVYMEKWIQNAQNSTQYTESNRIKKKKKKVQINIRELRVQGEGEKEEFTLSVLYMGRTEWGGGVEVEGIYNFTVL